MARRTKKQRTPTPSPEPDEVDDASGEGSGDEDESSEEEEVYVEPNLATRARRGNAGNRMQALLEDEAQAEVEEMFKEDEDDVEFAQKEEKDEFDSDFGSTDEGEGDEDDDDEAGERRLQREAKEAKKAAKGKKKKGFQAPVHPFARQTKAQRSKAAKEAADQGGAVASTSATTLDNEEKPAKKRRKSVDAAFLIPQRESTRRTAMASRREVQSRLDEAKQKKAVAPVKTTKKAQVTLTQADLIAEALETEEVNRAALLAFYAAEEDRREMERVSGMRYEIIGPKLSFLSRTENRVDKGKGKEKKPEAGRRRMIEVLGESGQKGWKGGAPETAGLANGSAIPTDPAPSASTSAPKTTRSSLRNILNSPAPLEPSSGPSTPPERPEFTRNWLVFGNTEEEPITRAQELEAVFGDHEEWTKPLPPPTKDRDGVAGRGYLCPITGLPAKYRDPRTLTPYATLAAYKVLTALVDSQAFVYSESAGAYTGSSGFGLMRDVQGSWARRPGAKAAAQQPKYAAAPTPTAPAAPMVGAAAQVLPTPGSSGSGVKRPRAPKQSSSQDNPYKVEYAHSGGTGRGQRGRTSFSDASGAPGTPSPAGAYPPQQMAPYAPHGQPQPQAQYAYSPQPGSPFAPGSLPPHNPYATYGVYAPSPLAGPVPQQHYPPPPPQAYHASPSPFTPQPPSLIGTSSAPQARSIAFPSSSSAAGARSSPFDPAQLPTFPGAPGGPGFVLPALPPLPGQAQGPGGAGGL
ncbi:hypothetical protein JCM10207_007849 [Rhodosporidiobolus poonsookiae]